jgi:hypothetical protein
VSLYGRVRSLPLLIDSYELEGRAMAVSSEFVRKTTVVRLLGAAEEGVGEDVTYDAREHDLQQARGAVLPLAGDWTLDSFSARLRTLPLFVHEPAVTASLDYRCWAFESAALDLALRQAHLSLADAVAREPRPVRFVVSMRLGEPPTTETLRRWLEHYPGLRFKLDATSSWTDELIDELRALGCVDSVDLKAFYPRTVVAQDADPGLYRRVAEGLPGAWIEDPAITPATVEILARHRERVTWDAQIHSVTDIEALPWPPRTVNVKPSRFGSVERLFAAYDYCARRGIGAYGGGQFELGPGRGQIQLLAALFHPEMPNDVAPGGFNEPEPHSELPASPLVLDPEPTGFRLRLS